MKKAFSLIELIFAIVIIGICLAAFPRIVEVSLKTDEISFRQEYFYELKEFYGIIKNLPLSGENICKDDYKSNSLLSQYCFSNAKHKYKNEIDLSFLNLNSRFQNGRNATKNGTNIQELAKNDIKTMDNSSVFITPKEIENALGTKIEYTIGDASKVDKYSTIQLKQANSSLKLDSASSKDTSDIGIYQLKITNQENQISSFYVFFPKYGRVNSVFSQYLLKTNDPSLKTPIEEKLKKIKDFK